MDSGKYDMQWKLYESGIRPRMAIMVSKLPHCLDDIPARYMQILSSDFVSRYRNRIINIHHSFLPAFPGAKPYHLAYTRGVKIIGGTSHYVTEDLEKIVLSRAIHAHLNRKVMVYKNKTIVFS